MNPTNALTRSSVHPSTSHPTPQGVIASLKELLPKKRSSYATDNRLTWYAEPPTVRVKATQHEGTIKVTAFSYVGRLTDLGQVLRLMHLWGAGEDAIATLTVNPDNGHVFGEVAVEQQLERWNHEVTTRNTAMLIEMLALQVRQTGKVGAFVGLTDVPDGDTELGWAHTSTVEARKKVALTGMQRWSHVTLTGASKLGPWFYGTRQDTRLKEMLTKGWRKHVGRSGSTVTLIAPHDEPHLSRVELSWADHSLTYGPMLRILVWPRHVQPVTASGFFRAQGPFGDPEQVGNWAASYVVPTAEVPDAPAPEGLVFAVHLPTAIADPFGMDTAWGWAERQASNASRRTSN